MKSINLQRTESLLMELIPEALSQLNDNRVNSLAITGVDCKQGKYDAKVYYDASDFDDKEKEAIKQILKKAQGRIKSYCLGATGWYKCPNFDFRPDDTIQTSNNIEKLFEQIKK